MARSVLIWRSLWRFVRGGKSKIHSSHLQATLWASSPRSKQQCSSLMNAWLESLRTTYVSFTETLLWIPLSRARRRWVMHDRSSWKPCFPGWSRELSFKKVCGALLTTIFHDLTLEAHQTNWVIVGEWASGTSLEGQWMVLPSFLEGYLPHCRKYVNNCVRKWAEIPASSCKTKRWIPPGLDHFVRFVSRENTSSSCSSIVIYQIFSVVWAFNCAKKRLL